MSLLNSTKNIVQKALNTFGWEVRRYYLSDMAQLCRFLDQNRIDVVLDVGANIGQFGGRLIQSGFKGKLISFEPLSVAHGRLTKAAASHRNWSVAPRAAVGAAAGETDINISENMVSSSLLPIRGEHVDSAPASKYVGSERTPVIALDGFSGLRPEDRVFLKIDTQGFEREVLAGAQRLLASNIVGVQVELSLASLYEGQPDYLELLTWLRDRGFRAWSLDAEFTDRASSRLLQANAVLFRG
jgi:FkbM family methyltransferase